MYDLVLPPDIKGLKSVYTSPHRLLEKERSPFEVFFGKRCDFDLLLLREDCRESEEIGKRLISLEENR